MLLGNQNGATLGQSNRGIILGPGSVTGVSRSDVMSAAGDIIFLAAILGTGYVACSQIYNSAKEGKAPWNPMSSGS